MNKKNLLIGCSSLVLGGIIYLLFRPETYVAKLLPQTPFLMHLRQALSGEGWDFLKFYFEWNNSQKNHLLNANFILPSPIKTVYSEDMNCLIKRNFDSEYNIRENLPTQKGFESKTNSAPMQRGLLIDEAKNNIGIVTKGLTQYEVFHNNLYMLHSCH